MASGTKKPVAVQDVIVKEAAFDAASLTIEQQKAVVEEYLGYSPDYFIWEGRQITLNVSQLEYDERVKSQKTGKPRKFFNGWKPALHKYK